MGALELAVGEYASLARHVSLPPVSSVGEYCGLGLWSPLQRPHWASSSLTADRTVGHYHRPNCGNRQWNT